LIASTLKLSPTLVGTKKRYHACISKDKSIRDGERQRKEIQTALRVLMRNQEDLQEALAESMLTQIKTIVLIHIEWLLEKKLSLCNHFISV